MKNALSHILDFFLVDLLAKVKIPSVTALMIANLFPLMGVLFFDWDLLMVFLLYWAESSIIGFFTILKMIRISWIGSLFMVPFFSLHYGGFMTGHFFFIVIFFGQDVFGGGPTSELSLTLIREILLSLSWAYAALFASHSFSFCRNFLGKKEYQNQPLPDLMARPYKRIILMHFTIILGGFLAALTGQSIAALIFLIFLKIIADISAHIIEHQPKTKNTKPWIFRYLDKQAKKRR